LVEFVAYMIFQSRSEKFFYMESLNANEESAYKN